MYFTNKKIHLVETQNYTKYFFLARQFKQIKNRGEGNTKNSHSKFALLNLFSEYQKTKSDYTVSPRIMLRNSCTGDTCVKIFLWFFKWQSATILNTWWAQHRNVCFLPCMQTRTGGEGWNKAWNKNWIEIPRRAQENMRRKLQQK